MGRRFMRVTCRGINKDLQLHLFTFDRARLAYGQTTDAIRPNGRKTLENIPAEDGRGTGSQGPTPGAAAGGRGADRGRDGPDWPPVETTESEATASPRPGLGDSPPPLHLPAAGALIDGHDLVIHPNGHHVANHEPGGSIPVPDSANDEDQGDPAFPDEEPPVVDPEPIRNQANYRITPDDRLGSGSLKQKCRDNLAAIELLKRLEVEGRPATIEEKGVLVRYVGWGGLPQVFDAWNDEWKEQHERLEQLLEPDELESARASTLNAHCTAPQIVQAMYAALARFGFTQGRILEPALDR